MAKLIKKIPVQATSGDLSDRKKALVFCMYDPVARQIVQQLEKRDIVVWLVRDEKQLIAQLEQADPELILIEVNAPTSRPLEGIIAEIFAWMRARARIINKLLESPSKYLWQHSKVVLFKSDFEITATGSLAAEMADTDDIVRQCSLWGEVKYIGLYSSFSFLSKVRPLLEQEQEM